MTEPVTPTPEEGFERFWARYSRGLIGKGWPNRAKVAKDTWQAAQQSQQAEIERLRQRLAAFVAEFDAYCADIDRTSGSTGWKRVGHARAALASLSEASPVPTEEEK